MSCARERWLLNHLYIYKNSLIRTTCADSPLLFEIVYTTVNVIQRLRIPSRCHQWNVHCRLYMKPPINARNSSQNQPTSLHYSLLSWYIHKKCGYTFIEWTKKKLWAVRVKGLMKRRNVEKKGREKKGENPFLHSLNRFMYECLCVFFFSVFFSDGFLWVLFYTWEFQ